MTRGAITPSVVRNTRRICILLSSHYPLRDVFIRRTTTERLLTRMSAAPAR